MFFLCVFDNLFCKIESFGCDFLFGRAVDDFLRRAVGLAVEIVLCVAFGNEFFRKFFRFGIFAFRKVVDFVFFADFLAFCNHLTLVDEGKESCQKQEHARRNRTEDNDVVFKALTEQNHSVDQERYCAADTAAKVDDCVCLRAQGLWRDVGHKCDCGGTEGCHCDKHQKKNDHIYDKTLDT